jgi:acetyltransferase-like isoleucine patch superfamily enzyme
MIRTLVNKIKYIWSRRSSAAYTKYLTDQGIKVGKGTYFQDPKYTEIDTTRPSLVTIGDNCFFNKHVEFHTHDWVSHVFIHSGREMVNSSGRITIGNNVAFGRHVTVLKGVTIGDNCFIGAHSVVTKSIPANSIAVGSPARVIMTLDEYYQRRLAVREQEAFDYARSIVERFGRRPEPRDFREEFPLFVSGNQVDQYPELPIRFQLGPTYDRYVQSHKAPYPDFESFLKAAGI